jgi:hypothetical protein
MFSWITALVPFACGGIGEGRQTRCRTLRNRRDSPRRHAFFTKYPRSFASA